MPYYDYVCKQCNSVTSVKASIEEKEAGLVVPCENCSSTETEQAFLNVAICSGSGGKHGHERASSRSDSSIGPCGHACGCQHG